MGGNLEPNYFTCTLGEAQRWKSKHNDSKAFDNVIDLIDRQAKEFPDLPAIGFSDLEGSTSSDCRTHYALRIDDLTNTYHRQIVPHFRRVIDAVKACSNGSETECYSRPESQCRRPAVYQQSGLCAHMARPDSTWSFRVATCVGLADQFVAVSDQFLDLNLNLQQ